MPIRVFVGYIYAMEFLPMNKTQKSTAIVMGNDGLVMAIAALWFMLISKNWKVLFSIATLLIYVTFGIVLTMPESPKYLISKGRFTEARHIMTYIARINKVEKFAFNAEEEMNYAEKNEKIDINQVDCNDKIKYECIWE